MRTLRVMRVGLWLLAMTAARAELADDLARIHVEALGGVKRLERLNALRVMGRTEIRGHTLSFVMWAERPNRVRIETSAHGALRVQAWNGVDVPWVRTMSAEGGDRVRRMSEGEARDFVVDADFDDALVDPVGRGYELGYEGERVEQGRSVHRIRVRHPGGEMFWLSLDQVTFLIVSRQSVRRLSDGREVSIETRYGDFRPVQGVLLPRRMEVAADGALLHTTILETVDPNPRIAPGFFDEPDASVTP